MHAISSDDGIENQVMMPSSSKGSNVEEVMNRIAERMKSWFKEL
jgi:cell division protein FtsA